MKKNLLPLFQFSIIVSTLLTLGVLTASPTPGERQIENLSPPDSVPDTTGGLRYPFRDIPDLQGDPVPVPSILHLKQPANIKSELEYDPSTNSYIVTEKAGSVDFRSPRVYDFKEYQELDANQSVHRYFKEKAKASAGGTSDGIIPSIYIGGQTFDRIFGGSTIDIRPTGSAELIFGLTGNRRDDPTISERQRSTLNFDFQEKIQMNVVAKIGTKIEFKANYNTESSFSFENKLQLKYEGDEDEIIKLIEVGNVNLPLNSTLIQGSQSLFGIKSKMKFGKTTVTAVVSQQESQTSSITVQGGAQTNTFSLKADQYEENKHFFLAQYFRDNYETGLSRLPIVISNVNITKMEVWVTNIGAAVTDNRNIVAFQDLGEKNPYNPVIQSVVGNPPYPDNKSNRLLNQLDMNVVRDVNQVSNYLKSSPFLFTAGTDFEKVESARKLNTSEFTYNSKLGFISLNTNLNADQTLAVSFQYTVVGDTGVYQVGEFSDDGISSPKCLMVKLLKSTAVNTRIPMWDLMMKNIYSIGSYQINAQDFILNILFSGNSNGVPTGYINDGDISGVPLIQVMNVDNLDAQLNRSYIVKDGDSILIPDGIFDFLDNAATQGGTINSKNGRVFFPVLEPFGEYLRRKIGNDQLADRYCYDSLYTMTKVGAQQYPDKNKFLLDGFYKSSSSSEISLNALNVPQGSVSVMMGGVKLNENVDYTVDYTLGRVKIINEALLSSGTPINISLENNSMFSIQSKTYLGMHVDHEFTKDFVLGATIINLTERPLTQKTILGDDPISNTLWGLNLAYQQESQLITRLIDKLPGIETKAPSKITVNAEFAHFIPGHSSAIGSEGTSYIDDFEGAQTTIRLSEPYWWFMASTPQGQTQQGMFPEGALGSGLAYGYNRARLGWYVIDPIFYDRTGGNRPSNVDKEELSKNSVRQVLENEVFPNKEIPNGQVTNISVLNLAYYPDERGPNNYDVEGLPGISQGLAENGKLNNPSSRWGGIMRKIESTDFEATNVEYIEFWMMDPFTEDVELQGGDLYFNLGDISEDILRDSRKSFENGLPTSAAADGVDTTIWGRVPKQQALVNAFDNAAGTRRFQDIGYDGLNDEDERTFFDQSYLQRIISFHGSGSEAFNQAFNDPSTDNYHYFRGTDYDQDERYTSVLERYKKYNGTEGNSPASDDVNEAYITSATDAPNVEDINFDNTLWEDERYFQYKVSIRPQDMVIGTNYITDIYTTKSIALENGDRTTVKWYQFKIPVTDPSKIVGDIKDFKSIRFIRMFFKNFSRPIVTRFASLELVRGEWRRYKYDLLSSGEYIPNDEQWGAKFEISTLNVEENGSKQPIPYVIPPGIEREINYGSTNNTRLNEQAMVLRVKELVDGDARAAYKTTGFDFRQYKRLKMFVHAEDMYESEPNAYGDLTVFLRLGSDFTQNYYEYEIPLTFTAWGSTNAEDIWPELNRFDIDLERLVSIKQQRNVDRIASPSSVSQLIPYIAYDGKNKISIVGSPSLSDVKAIMIGVRNPKRQTIQSADDGKPKSAEIWVNELRLSDFVNEQGWAATARFTATLADLGNVAVAGSYSTPGFGSIEKKANERQKETAKSFDFSTNLQLGKFFPEDYGIKIPFHFDYSKAIKTPEYNPLDPDVKMDDALASLSTEAQRDSLSRIADDLVQRKNFSLLNVRKERIGNTGTPMPWDVENFDVSYSYSETNIHNIDLEYDNKRTYRGGLGYNYMLQPPLVKPFEKISFISKAKALQLIRDFNFYYLPRMFSFRTDLNRDYTERKLRNKSTADVILTPSYLKSFVWNRTYDLKFDLTQSLKLEYNATANAMIDELPGSIDKDDYYTVAEKQDELWKNITGFGRMNRYNQQVNANYTIPINKIPLFDWVTANARYQGTYTWTASARSIQEIMGNTIENSNSKQINAQFKFTTIYNKIGYLKKLNQPKRPDAKKPPLPKGNVAKPAAQQKVADSTKKEEGPSYARIVADQILRLAMMVRDGRISYTETNGMLLPGVTYTPGTIGNDFNLSAPGVGFVFGLQDDIRYRASEGRWLTEDTLFNGAFATKYTTALSLALTLEPLRDLKIDLTGTRTYSLDHSEYFRSSDGMIDVYSEVDRGSFSISYITLGTAFTGLRDDNSSAVYDQMKSYRYEVAFRLARANPNWMADQQLDSLGFPLGYGQNQQEVLHYAFLAAYGNKTPAAVATEAFPKIPLPNWRITYKGLMSIDFIKEYLKDITLSHTYRSTYNVGSFASNVLYQERNGAPSARDASSNFIPLYQISQITITEQFVPLFGIDMTWKNSLLSRIEFKKTRNLSMSFTNGQITEVASNEIVLGMGYRIKDLQLVFKGGGTAQKFKSDLNLKADFSIKDNRTILRRIEEGLDQISAGMRVLSLSLSADYQMNQRLSIRAFFEKTINNPYVSNQYANSVTKGGISLRFSLAQ